MPKLVLIAHNIRSAHNVGSLLRTADGLGIDKIYLTGYSPYPMAPDDSRLPHIARKADHAINKTALGAQESVAWEHLDNLTACAAILKKNGYEIVALEQTPNAAAISEFEINGDTALIVGNETEGISPKELACADRIVQIPMAGRKESFNVAIAAAIALYQFKYQ